MLNRFFNPLIQPSPSGEGFNALYVMLNSFLICLVFGSFSGLIAGLFGLGGGLILVPFFIILFEAQGIEPQHITIMAIATSLATVLMTATRATLAQQKLGNIHWGYVKHLSQGMIIGVISGSYLAAYIPANTLKLIFACYMAYSAIKILQPSKPIALASSLSHLRLILSGFFIGHLSSLVGIGGGTLTVPLLVKYQIPIKQAIASSSACGFPIALIASISYVNLGWHQEALPYGSLGYLYLPAVLGISLSSFFSAPLGARLSNQLPTQTLKRYFALLLLIVMLKLIIN